MHHITFSGPVFTSQSQANILRTIHCIRVKGPSITLHLRIKDHITSQDQASHHSGQDITLYSINQRHHSKSQDQTSHPSLRTKHHIQVSRTNFTSHSFRPRHHITFSGPCITSQDQASHHIFWQKQHIIQSQTKASHLRTKHHIQI